MFRTVFCSFSLSGISLVKGTNNRRGFFSLNAETPPVDNKEVIHVEQNTRKHGSIFMAEPLTDEETREANKDNIRVRMELMIMRIQKEFCKALENEEDPRYGKVQTVALGFHLRFEKLRVDPV